MTVMMPMPACYGRGKRDHLGELETVETYDSIIGARNSRSRIFITIVHLSALVNGEQHLFFSYECRLVMCFPVIIVVAIQYHIVPLSVHPRESGVCTTDAFMGSSLQ